MTKRTLLLAISPLLALTIHPSHAHEWNQNIDGFVTRCFQVSNINVYCDDLSEPAWGILERAELNIEATDRIGNRFSYGYLRGIEGPLCKTHLQRIQKLLKNAPQACITGQSEQTLKTGETTARWRDLETPAGKVRW